MRTILDVVNRVLSTAPAENPLVYMRVTSSSVSIYYYMFSVADLTWCDIAADDTQL